MLLPEEWLPIDAFTWRETMIVDNVSPYLDSWGWLLNGFLNLKCNLGAFSWRFFGGFSFYFLFKIT